MGLKRTENFEEMLKEYQPHKLIEDQMKKTNYFWSKIKKDKGWKDGATYQIPWELAEASAFQIGGLVESAKITDAKFKKANETDHAFMSGAMKWFSRDLKRYGDMRQSFLKLLPMKTKKFTTRMQYLTNLIMLDGASISRVTADGTGAGVLAVLKPQRFMVGERVVVISTDGGVADVECYVGAIDINGKTISCVDAAGAAVDLSSFVVAGEVVEVKIPGYDQDNFYSLTDFLLPASLGGSDTVHGVNKSESPILQAQVESGAGWTKSTILSNLYDFYFGVKELGKVDGVEILCGFDVYKAASNAAESSKRYMTSKESGPGFSSVVIDGPMGEMKLVALEQMPNDRCHIVDFDHFTFAGDEFFKNMVDPDGNLYTKERVAGGGAGNDGHVLIQDIALSGQLICTRPSSSASIHSISL